MTTDRAAPAAELPIIKRLEDARVLSVRTSDDGTFCFDEACDYYYSVNMTAGEVEALARELLAMVNRPAAALRRPEWQPIATAPECGTWGAAPRCLVFGDCGIQFGRVYRYPDGTVYATAEGFNGEWNITLWQPHPAPPAALQPEDAK